MAGGDVEHALYVNAIHSSSPRQAGTHARCVYENAIDGEFCHRIISERMAWASMTGWCGAPDGIREYWPICSCRIYYTGLLHARGYTAILFTDS